jgi:OmpA-OmpF porin, OOP family
MNRISLSVAGLAALLAAASVSASDVDTAVDTRPYISVGGSYVFEDDSRDSEGGDGYWLSVGKSFNRFWGLEFSGFHNQFDARRPGGPEWEEQGGELSVLYYYARGESFSPYFSLGAGWLETEEGTSGLDSTDAFGAAGVGFFKSFSLGRADLGLRGDLRYRWLDAQDIGAGSPFEEAVVRLGLVVPLGADPTPTPEAVPVAKPLPVGDADGDGVPDDRDRCPDTAAGLAVDADGCPPPPVPAKGFDPITFPFDAHHLTDFAKAQLQAAVRVIRERLDSDRDRRLALAGHTDWMGTEGYNQALSERRARSVRDYLIKLGVPADRIQADAYGETRPAASNDTEAGRARNRRVELQWVE